MLRAPSPSDAEPTYHGGAPGKSSVAGSDAPAPERRGLRVMEHVRVLLVIAALAFAAYLAGTSGRAIDAGRHETYSRDLARLETLDHALSEDLMRARSRLIANYDPLVRTMHELREVHERLAAVPDFLPAEGRGEMRGAVERSARLLARQSELLERFKSDNAILSNSVRFIPVAAHDLAASSGDASVISTVDALVREVLLLNLWNERASMVRIREELATLARTPGLDPARLELVRSHAEVIVERRPRIERWLGELGELQRARRDDRLDGLYRSHHAIAADAAARDSAVLSALAIAIVVLGAAFIILRMRRSALALEQTTAQLASAVDMKNRFVSMTSHEFRTPLAVILSSTELLEAYADRWKPEKKAEHFGRIRASVQNMTQLIDGILLIGKGEAGVLDFRPAATDLDRICREVIAAVVARSGQPREIEYEPPEVVDAHADERLIRHALDNLLSNAIKYSPGGGRVRLVARSDGREATFVVSDEGVGIPGPDRERLFQSFQRGSNVGTIPGTGLGLAVVKRAVDLHRGSVRVQSEVGSGSRFEVVLPIGRGGET